MTRRRSQSDADWVADALAEWLTRVPVWVGPVSAVAAYLAFRFIAPPLLGLLGKPFGPELSRLAPTLAPLVAFIVLGLWVCAEITRRKRRWLLDSRSDIQSLRALSWQDFEELVGEAYRRQGYDVTVTGGGGADGGVDLTLRQAGAATLVQCKRWRAWKVGVNVVRELYGVVAAEHAARGIIVTSGCFTPDARAFATGKPLELVDGSALWELVKDVQARRRSTPVPSTQPVNTIPPRPSPTSGAASPAAVPACPVCRLPMVPRTARQGPNAGTKFWGCRQYPACRGTRPLQPSAP